MNRQNYHSLTKGRIIRNSSKSQIKKKKNDYVSLKSRNISPKLVNKRQNNYQIRKKHDQGTESKIKSVKKKNKRKRSILKGTKVSMKTLKPVLLFKENRNKKNKSKEKRKKSQLKLQKRVNSKSKKKMKKIVSQKVYHCKEGRKIKLKTFLKQKKQKLNEENIEKFYNKMKKLKKDKKLQPLSQSKIIK
jgi:hypothetical protein